MYACDRPRHFCCALATFCCPTSPGPSRARVWTDRAASGVRCIGIPPTNTTHLPTTHRQRNTLDAWDLQVKLRLSLPHMPGVLVYQLQGVAAQGLLRNEGAALPLCRAIPQVNTLNIKNIIPEIFGENIIRGKGLLCRSVMKAQVRDTRPPSATADADNPGPFSKPNIQSVTCAPPFQICPSGRAVSCGWGRSVQSELCGPRPVRCFARVMCCPCGVVCNAVCRGIALVRCVRNGSRAPAHAHGDPPQVPALCRLETVSQLSDVRLQALFTNLIVWHGIMCDSK